MTTNNDLKKIDVREWLDEMFDCGEELTEELAADGDLVFDLNTATAEELQAIAAEDGCFLTGDIVSEIERRLSNLAFR